ncbi:MAG: hypothetical protein ABR899_03095 [Candidatus Krumholzibacteriaceae bacterium]
MTAAGRCSKLIMLVLALMIFHSNLTAKERSTKFGVWDIGFALTGGFIDQAYCPDDSIKLRMPAYISNERHHALMVAYYPELKTDYLTDNPLMHGAIWTHVAVEARNAGLRLFCKLIMEHRGTSFGTYATQNIAVVPTFFASVDTSFAVAGQTFRAGLEGGNYEDHKLYEGLTIYNMDLQGYHLHLKWKNLKVSADHISDLWVGIGLNIDDEADYTVSVEDVPLGARLKLNMSAGYVKYLGGADDVNGLPENGMNVSGALRWGDMIRLYSQLGVRSVEDPSFGGIKRCADLVGCTYRGELKERLDLSLTGEYRYYGRYFNEGRTYDGGCFLYRGYDGYTGCGLWNFTGSQLYPLNEFFRPFSQWAVYTDYAGRDVQTFIFRADATYKLPGNCSLICNLDFNYLEVSNEDPFLYPFYNLGIGWAPAPGTTIAISHTNRAMNLDKHYPTLYLTENGTFMVTLQSALSF